jgi:hypothetical protein
LFIGTIAPNVKVAGNYVKKDDYNQLAISFITSGFFNNSNGVLFAKRECDVLPAYVPMPALSAIG